MQVWKRKAEEYLANSGVPYTIIRYTVPVSFFSSVCSVHGSKPEWIACALNRSKTLLNKL
jgi:hypothetical protein